MASFDLARAWCVAFFFFFPREVGGCRKNGNHIAPMPFRAKRKVPRIDTHECFGRDCANIEHAAYSAQQARKILAQIQEGSRRVARNWPTSQRAKNKVATL